MNALADAAPGPDAPDGPNRPEGPVGPAGGPAARPATRPLLWSVRRELWENRSIVLAPLAVAALAFCGLLISALTLPHRMPAIAALGPAQQRAALARPYDFAAGFMVLIAFLVGVFYCLDALHGERRERSILFWKSLPVSDRTTVLSKASIPLVVLPLLTFAVVVVMQGLTLLSSTAFLRLNGLSPATLWARLSLFQRWVALLYSLVAISLWHAPLYGWFLLISGWARRAALLWALLPPLVIAAFERGAFGTSAVGLTLLHRLIGWFQQAFVAEAARGVPLESPLSALDPVKFLSSPGLWLGLALAAAFLATAVRQRRTRDPI